MRATMHTSKRARLSFTFTHCGRVHCHTYCGQDRRSLVASGDVVTLRAFTEQRYWRQAVLLTVNDLKDQLAACEPLLVKQRKESELIAALAVRHRRIPLADNCGKRSTPHSRTAEISPTSALENGRMLRVCQM